MRNVFAAHWFAAAVQTRRGERTLRQAAAEIGTVSPATLLRFEQEKVRPDLLTFLCVCDWLQLHPTRFLHSDDSEAESLDNLVERELRADAVLAPLVIDAFLILYRVVRTA